MTSSRSGPSKPTIPLRNNAWRPPRRRYNLRNFAIHDSAIVACIFHLQRRHSPPLPFARAPDGLNSATSFFLSRSFSQGKSKELLGERARLFGSTYLSKSAISLVGFHILSPIFASSRRPYLSITSDSHLHFDTQRPLHFISAQHRNLSLRSTRIHTSQPTTHHVLPPRNGTSGKPPPLLLRQRHTQIHHRHTLPRRRRHKHRKLLHRLCGVRVGYLRTSRSARLWIRRIHHHVPSGGLETFQG